MKNKNGFTLIELLVSITIGVIVVGLGSVALNDFNEKQKIESTRQELLANLRLARNYAVTNQLPAGGNRVSATVDVNGVVTLQSRDASDIGASTLFSKDITPKGIGITFVPATIRFSVSDGRSFNIVSGNIVGTTATISIVGTGTSKTVKIDESGLVYGE